MAVLSLRNSQSALAFILVMSTPSIMISPIVGSISLLICLIRIDFTIITAVIQAGRYQRQNQHFVAEYVMDRNQLCSSAANHSAWREAHYVPVDTLDDAKFRQITRWGELSKVKEGMRLL